jgi:hypothetical protein
MKLRRMRWVGHAARMGGKMRIGYCGKARGKEAARKTKTVVG